MTAQVVNLFPTGAQAEDTIRATVRGLLKGRGMSVDDIAPLVHMSASSLYRKLAATGDQNAFKAGEVASLARVLKVDVGDLYSGLGGAFIPPTPGPGVSMTSGEYIDQSAA